MNLQNLSDYHIHSRFSSDSDESPEEIIRTAIALGLKEICFTDHMDLDYPEQDGKGNPLFVFDTEEYFDTLLPLKEKYRNRLTIRLGIELGLMPELSERNEAVARSCPFDFIIGSTHLVDGQDPYYPRFWEGRKTEEVIRHYFETTHENIKAYADYDVYGHLDYITRYVPDKAYRYDCHRFMEVIDAILKDIIHSGHGIELNTSPFGKGLSDPNPCREILLRYRELGGEIITLGSDAHEARNIGGGFDRARDILTDCGFKYYAVFTRRRPEFIPFA